MRRVAALCTAIALGSGLVACIPNLPGLPFAGAPSPVADLQPTSVPSATMSPIATSTTVSSPTAAFTPIPTFTPANVAATGTAQAATPSAGTSTATATAAQSISLDKLPAGTVYKRVRIENRAREQMDISLHCTTVKGLHTVIEYTNVRNLLIQAPEGDYVYVFYVGGHPLMGSFSLVKVPSVTITVYKDHVAIH